MGRTGRKSKIHILFDRCKGCKICVEFCPAGTLRIGGERNALGFRYVEVIDELRCIGCRVCEYYCPDFAIYIAASP